MAARVAPAPYILLNNQTGRGDIPLGSLQGHVSLYSKEALLRCIQRRIPVCVVRVLMGQAIDGTPFATVHLQQHSVDADTSQRIHDLVSDWQRSLPCTYNHLVKAPATRTFSVSSFITRQYLSGPDGRPRAFLGIYPEGTLAVGEPPIKLQLGPCSTKEFASLNTGQSLRKIRVLTDSCLSTALVQALHRPPCLRRCDAMQRAAHHNPERM